MNSQNGEAIGPHRLVLNLPIYSQKAAKIIIIIINNVYNNYQHDSKVLHTSVSNESFGQLLRIKPPSSIQNLCKGLWFLSFTQKMGSKYGKKRLVACTQCDPQLLAQVKMNDTKISKNI